MKLQVREAGAAPPEPGGVALRQCAATRPGLVRVVVVAVMVSACAIGPM
jgi:hypothetical protein